MCNMIFRNRGHEEFYRENMRKAGVPDTYHKSLFYLLGIEKSTREHFGQIFNIKNGCVNPECVCQGWLTGTYGKIVRLAFNLYTGGLPTVDTGFSEQEKAEEYGQYSVNTIFCCDYAKYFWEGIKLRYPEYTKDSL